MKKTRNGHKLRINEPINQSRIVYGYDNNEYGGWYNIFDDGSFSGKADIFHGTLIEDWMINGDRLFKKSNSDFKTINKATVFYYLWYTIRGIIVKTLYFRTSEVLADSIKTISISKLNMNLLSSKHNVIPFKKTATMIFKYGIYGYKPEDDLGK